MNPYTPIYEYSNPGNPYTPRYYDNGEHHYRVKTSPKALDLPEPVTYNEETKGLTMLADAPIDNKTFKKALYESAIESIIFQWNHMFRHSGWFDICTIDNTLHRLGLKRDRKEFHYEYLTSFHCNHWKVITPETKQIIVLTMLITHANPRLGYNRKTDKFVDTAMVVDQTDIVSIHNLADKFESAPKQIKPKTLWQKLKSYFNEKI